MPNNEKFKTVTEEELKNMNEEDFDENGQVPKPTITLHDLCDKAFIPHPDEVFNPTDVPIFSTDDYFNSVSKLKVEQKFDFKEALHFDLNNF